MKMNKGNQWGTVLLVALTLLAGRAAGEPAPLSDESRTCLDCHAKPGIIKLFENNESLIAYVDTDKFQASVHNSLACSSCHPDFSSGKHPTREFKTKAQYQIRILAYLPAVSYRRADQETRGPSRTAAGREERESACVRQLSWLPYGHPAVGEELLHERRTVLL